MALKTNDGIDISKAKVNPRRVFVRIKGEERENVFLGKEITTEQGKKVRLVKTIDCAPDMDRKSALFVREGEVVKVGRFVDNIQEGDIAILDYKVDNDNGIIIGWIGEDKIVCPAALTEYVEKTQVYSANRQTKKDTIIAKEGEIQTISDVIGVIRKGEFFAQDPYVILKFKPATEKKETLSGIIYDEHNKYIDLEVLAVSDYSRRIFGIVKGCTVKVLETDTFRVDTSKAIILVCNDSDIKMITIHGSKEDALIEVLK